MLVKNTKNRVVIKNLKKNIENKLFLNTIYNIDFLINAITVLIKNAYYHNNLNIILDNFILSEINKNVDNVINDCNNCISNNNFEKISNYYLKIIKQIIKVFFKNLSPTLLNTDNEIFTIENKFECALHMFFTVNLEKDTSDNVISKYYDYYYSIDDNKCNLNFGIYDNCKMNDIKKKIILDGIHLFIKKCLELKIDFSNEDIRHIKFWNIKFFDKTESVKLENLKSNQCPICLDCYDFNNSVTTKCNHNYCFDCFNNMIKLLKPYHNPICPLCRSSVEELYMNTSKKKDFIVI